MRKYLYTTLYWLSLLRGAMAQDNEEKKADFRKNKKIHSPLK